MFNKKMENEATLKKLEALKKVQPVNLTLKLDFTEVFLAQLAIVFLGYLLFSPSLQTKSKSNQEEKKSVSQV